MLRFALVLILCGMSALPARAADDAPHRCGLFCKIWRNVSGRVQARVPETASWDDRDVSLPGLDDDARQPRSADVVATPGEVIRKTPQERRREQAALAESVRRIDALRESDGHTGTAGHGAQQARANPAN